MNVLGKFLERIGMVVVFFVATTVIFLLYSVQVEHDYVKDKVNNMMTSYIADGKITDTEFIEFSNALALLNNGYEFEFVHKEYLDLPYYHTYTQSEQDAYYTARNDMENRKLFVENKMSYNPDEIAFLRGTSELRYQKFTNRSVLSGQIMGEVTYTDWKDFWLPLPKDDEDDAKSTYTVISGLDLQVCYDGEPLVTVVRAEEQDEVTKQWATFYLTLLEVDAETSRNDAEKGPLVRTVQLQNTDGTTERNGVALPKITVRRYPRTTSHIYEYTDTNGNKVEVLHEYNITKDMIDYCENNYVIGNTGSDKMYGEHANGCPICAITPKHIILDFKDSYVNGSKFVVPVGVPFKEMFDSVSIEYANGVVSPIWDSSSDEPFPYGLSCEYYSNYLGEQKDLKVVYYEGLSEYTITTEGRPCILGCGNKCSRTFSDYGVNMVCSKCSEDKKIPVFLGETYIQENEFYMDDIINEVSSKGYYAMQRGDYLTLKVLQNRTSFNLPFLGETASFVYRDGRIVRTNGE